MGAPSANKAPVCWLSGRIHNVWKGAKAARSPPKAHWASPDLRLGFAKSRCSPPAQTESLLLPRRWTSLKTSLRPVSRLWRAPQGQQESVTVRPKSILELRAGDRWAGAGSASFVRKLSGGAPQALRSPARTRSGARRPIQAAAMQPSPTRKSESLPSNQPSGGLSDVGGKLLESAQVCTLPEVGAVVAGSGHCPEEGSG